MSNLLQEIEAQISGVKTSVNKQNVGIVRECADGVAKIEGLTDAMLNEMLDFGNGVTGLALVHAPPGKWRLYPVNFSNAQPIGSSLGETVEVPAGKEGAYKVMNVD